MSKNDLMKTFVDNKLSIHFGVNKTKSILFDNKRRAKSICQLKIRYKEKQYKTAFGNNISWMCAGRDDVRRTNGIKSYIQKNR